MGLRVTLKFLKQRAFCGPAVRLKELAEVIEIDDPVYSVDNSFETIICLNVPKHSPHRLRFEILGPVRRVILGGHDLNFEVDETMLYMTLPALEADNDRVADMHMIVESEGIEFRVEVPNRHQSSGEYQCDSYPHRARLAATTLEFALLDAVQCLGLDQTIGKGPCGPIYIMGFDTNNPCGHTDWPPHVHLHMARPSRDAPIGHYYFDSQLRIGHNDMYRRGTTQPYGTFGPNEPCPHLAPDGSLLFDLMITRTGGLHLTNADGHAAQIEAVEDGFDTGAALTCRNIHRVIKIDPEPPRGQIIVSRGHIKTTYHYDADTGQFEKLHHTHSDIRKGEVIL